MTHKNQTLTNEAARLRAFAQDHKNAAATGLPFERGGHTYKGDAAWHLGCARRLERIALNLLNQVTDD